MFCFFNLIFIGQETATFQKVLLNQLKQLNMIFSFSTTTKDLFWTSENFSYNRLIKSNQFGDF